MKDGARAPILDQGMRDLIAEHDVAAVNFEGPSVQLSKPMRKAGPSLSMDPSAPGIAEKLGFSLISMANNHAMDHGYDSLEATRKAFKQAAVIGIGSYADAYRPKIIEADGARVAFLAASEKQFGAISGQSDKGYAWLCHPEFRNIVAAARKTSDCVVVFAHCGLEDIDIPLPQWRSYLKSLIGAGADAIVSTHPHRMQGMEIHEGKPIFYSLGNLSFGYKADEPGWNDGYAVSLEIGKSGVTSWKRSAHRIDSSNTVRLVEADLDALDKKLLPPAYDAEIKKTCLEMWRDIYKRYYGRALPSFEEGRPLRNIKLLVKELAGMNKTDPTMLWHNIAIESHRFAVEVALEELQAHE